MLSPLRPLLCRHEYYWSERHRTERCRRCGKLNPAAAPAMAMAGSLASHEGADPFAGVEVFPPVRAGSDLDFPPPPEPEATQPDPAAPEPDPAPAPEAAVAPDRATLKAESQARRQILAALFDRLVAGEPLSRDEALDAVLAVIDDAHSADPVLFGDQAAAQFARLRAARNGEAMVPATGIEPVTFGLQNRCSTS